MVMEAILIIGCKYIEISPPKIFSSDEIRLHEVLPHERVFHLGKINVSLLALQS